MKKHMKITKRILSLAMTVILVLGMSACGSAEVSSEGGEGGSQETKKQYVIGIGEAQANDEVAIRRAYLDNYIAPKYNVKFIYSEVLADDTMTKEFIENCADSGADAVIDFKTVSAQMARLCEENGMIYTSNGTIANAPELRTENLPMYAGNGATNYEQSGQMFKDWLQNAASDDGSEGFLVATALASRGNAQHTEITVGILEGLQQKYGLTYEQSVEDLAAASDTTNVSNDKGILITLYPGSPNKETWLPGVSNLLQTGKYGVFMSSAQTYNQSATAVDEVERNFNKNIKVASIGALGTTLTTAFNTNDAFGNPSVDFIAIKPISAATAALFAITYNALVNGDASICRDNAGNVINFSFNFIAVTSPDQLAEMDGWDDKDGQNWIANEVFVNDLLLITNPNANGGYIDDVMKAMTFETIKANMG